MSADHSSERGSGRPTDEDDPQLAVLRRMAPGDRWLAAQRLYWSMREIKAGWLRRQNPDWTDAQVQDAVREIFRHAAD